MSGATYYIGDVFDVMATMPDDSVDLVLTSPPFLALRSYLPADHPDKAKEIGSEPTPAEFLDTLLALTAEWGRLIGPYGSICVELGDTYAGTTAREGIASGDSTGTAAGRTLVDGGDSSWRQGATTYQGGTRTVDKVGTGWPLDKSLCGIPHLYHLSLAYGRNLLTGEPSPAGQWRVRNVVAWCRPNPPVGALGDKFRPATSYMTIATKARDRWFDLDAVRTEPSRPRLGTTAHKVDPGADPNALRGSRTGVMELNNPAGAPPLDWWEVSTEAYPGSHYATWPRKLLTRPILAMCPQQVCTTCGEPRRRMTEKSPEYDAVGRNWADAGTDGRTKAGARERNAHSAQPPGDHIQSAEWLTVCWSDCGHDNFRNGIVLDPFAGSGTTLAVATGHGRDAIGIDIDERNADLATARIGMFLTVTDTRKATA